ncbi:hypothetical protein [Pseudomonas sp. GM_Psu_2]|uniref:hypothetical protein n=1 Tax=unclassified Pseudomonas TaxID=196821 RepID=UPI002269B96A|nr:hypothetical protein [Pseudomonas sp. GM_Psu_2]
MNTCANLFHSESELRAALGSAAILDPVKHPRRWEIAQARKKVNEKTKSNRAAQYEAAQALMDPRALAISLTHSGGAATRPSTSRPTGTSPTRK